MYSLYSSGVASFLDVDEEILELQRLSRAHSTNVGYTTAWNHWTDFAGGRIPFRLMCDAALPGTPA